jgi:hypothetical protein
VGFALLGMREFFRRHFIDAIVATTTAMIFILFFSSIPTWSGEWTYGPRYILFVLPTLSLPFILLIDRIFAQPRKLLNAGLGLVISITLIYSGYLQFRVNSIRFFAFQQIRRNLESGWPEPVRAFFQDHHVGRTMDQLIRHRNNLDALPVFDPIKQFAPPEMVDAIRSLIQDQCLPRNRYWWNDPQFP